MQVLVVTFRFGKLFAIFIHILSVSVNKKTKNICYFGFVKVLITMSIMVSALFFSS